MTAWPIRWMVGILTLIIVLAWVDPLAVARALGSLHAGWIALAVAISVPQLLVSALRWRLTAKRLGAELPLRTAVADYYLATFINQVVPGGVVGDVARAWRHAEASGQTAGALRAVVFERTSGQVVMVALALPLALALPGGISPFEPPMTWTDAVPWLVVAAVAMAIAAGIVFRHRRRLLTGLGRDLHRALLAPDVVWLQLLGSLLIVASYALMFLCAARALGSHVDSVELLMLAPPVLLAMLIPISAAGWGVREAAAAGVWSLAGLAPADGVAVSIVYGLVVLVSSLPGALLLIPDAAAAGRRSYRRRS